MGIDPIAGLAALQAGPQPFDGIQLGIVGQQGQSRDVFRDLQCPGPMRSRLIEHPYNPHMGSGLSADRQRKGD